MRVTPSSQDNSYTFRLMAAPTSKLLMKAAGRTKGGGQGRMEVVATITYDQMKVSPGSSPLHRDFHAAIGPIKVLAN